MGTRLDDVDADAVLAQHRAQGFAQHADGALGPAIGDLGGAPTWAEIELIMTMGAAMTSLIICRAASVQTTQHRAHGLEQIVEGPQSLVPGS